MCMPLAARDRISSITSDDPTIVTHREWGAKWLIYVVVSAVVTVICERMRYTRATSFRTLFGFSYANMLNTGQLLSAYVAGVCLTDQRTPIVCVIYVSLCPCKPASNDSQNSFRVLVKFAISAASRLAAGSSAAELPVSLLIFRAGAIPGNLYPWGTR